MTILVAYLLSLSAKPVLAQFQAAKQEWELNVEGGADFRGFRALDESLVTVTAPSYHQVSFSPVAGLSAYLRIPALRAYYGLRLEGHYTQWDDSVQKGNAYTAAALFSYKAFLFDMEGDCDCPRWDKSNFFKKAFFVEFGAGYGRQGYSIEDSEGDAARGGAAYMARLGLALRLKKQIDVYIAGGGHGFIGPDQALGQHELAVRPALGVTWRPYYNRY